ncbi:peptidoglycan-binding protein [Rhodobacterales bacterium LSUCC0031]|nr:peptidoglycan-binding protein [Rhodobacterales bacterium LSUCC0031]
MSAMTRSRGSKWVLGRFLASMLAIMLGSFLTIGLSALTVQPAGAQVLASAQDQVFVQIESNTTLTTTENRARIYAQTLPDVNAFRARTGLYAIALGPYAAADAAAILRDLLAQGLIPRDSFVVDGSPYQARVFPIGDAGIAASAPMTPPLLDTPPTSEAATIAADVASAPASALTQPVLAAEPMPATTPIAQPQPEETLQQARQSEGELDRPARDALQIALQWFGHYTARIDGSFGPGTRRAMGAWQAANGHEPTGVLTTSQRAALLASYESELAALGMETVRDDRAGIEIALPMALVRFDQYNFPFAQFAPVDDSGVQVMLISQQGDSSTLSGLYQIMQTLDIVPLEGARERQGDRFLLTGRSDSLRSHTEARLVGGTVKGFTIVWPPEQDARIARILSMMQESFTPRDGTLEPDAIPPEAVTAIDLVAGLSIRTPELVRSGFFIDANGLVMTTAEAVAGQCARVLIDDAYPAEIALRDDTLGLAVLRPLQPLAPMRFAEMATAPGRISADVAVAGFPFDGALGAASMAFGTLAELRGINGEETVQRLDLPTAASEAGGPVFDTTGTVLGMVLPGTAAGRVLPENVTLALRADQFGQKLRDAGINTQASTRSGTLNRELLARLGAEMTVTVSCWN